MKVLEGSRAHLAHLQYHAYGGDDWYTMRSEPRPDRRVLQRPPEPHDATPARCCSATPSPSPPTARGSTCSTSSPAASGATSTSRTRPAAASCPTSTRRRTSSTPCSGPSGLELLLLINDPWRVYLTTDHPNGAAFWRYPEIIQLLMNADFRKEQLKKLPPKALKRIVLPDLDREYTLSEIAIITSAGPARALGLPQKGHLGVGADADVAIFNENKDVATMFAYPRYVIKGGEVVIEEGEIRNVGRGPRVRSCSPTYDAKIEDYLRPLFQQYYTMSFDNYPVELERIEHAGGPAVPAAEPTTHEPRSPSPLKEQPARPAGGRGPLAGRDRRRCGTTRSAPCRCSWASGSAGSTTSSTSRARQRRDLEIRGDVGPGEVDRPRHDPRADHASSATPGCTSGAYMKGGTHRGDRQRLGLGRRRDDRRPDPHPRQRRRAGRRGLPRQPVRA